MRDDAPTRVLQCINSVCATLVGCRGPRRLVPAYAHRFTAHPFPCKCSPSLTSRTQGIIHVVDRVPYPSS